MSEIMKFETFSRLAPLITILLGPWVARCRAMEETGMHESSDAYLRNVVGELQLLNGFVSPSTTAAISRPPAPTQPDYLERFADGHDTYPQQFPVRNPPRNPPRNPVGYYEQQPISQTTTILGFTPAELAAMYRKALEQGNAMKYSSLVNTISHQMPKIFAAPIQVQPTLPPIRPEETDSQYAYYFYPLDTFRHELTNNYGYRTVPDVRYDLTPAENQKKETSAMHPILVGISSFLGMALLFIVSLFVYPRFMHYFHFPLVTSSRKTLPYDLDQLTVMVTEAIDYYNKNSRKIQRRSRILRTR